MLENWNTLPNPYTIACYIQLQADNLKKEKKEKGRGEFLKSVSVLFSDG